MSGVTSTNIRVGPGFYLAIKHLAGNNLSMGLVANLYLMMGFWQVHGDNFAEALKDYPDAIQKALMADILSTLGEILKLVGSNLMRDVSITDLYKLLLNPGKDNQRMYS